MFFVFMCYRLTVLHLASWRGDAKCLELLLNHGAISTQRATDGRNGLHFLYQYCNKPCDLVQATSLLIKHGEFVCNKLSDLIVNILID